MLQVASNCRWQSAKLPDINTTYIWESPLKFNHLSHSHTHSHPERNTCNRVEFNAICCSHQSNCCQSMADATRMSANHFPTILRNSPGEEEKLHFLAVFPVLLSDFSRKASSIYFNPQLNYYSLAAKGFLPIDLILWLIQYFNDLFGFRYLKNIIKFVQ